MNFNLTCCWTTAIATLFILPSAIAATRLPAPAGVRVDGDRLPLVAQRSPNYCRSGESMFLSLETRSYWINICGGDLPGSYVGVEKRNPQNRIRLPLRDYTPQGTYFEAVNGEYTYILAQTPRGKFLTVSQGTRELLREPILTPW